MRKQLVIFDVDVGEQNGFLFIKSIDIKLTSNVEAKKLNKMDAIVREMVKNRITKSKCKKIVRQGGSRVGKCQYIFYKGCVLE